MPITCMQAAWGNGVHAHNYVPFAGTHGQPSKPGALQVGRNAALSVSSGEEKVCETPRKLTLEAEARTVPSLWHEGSRSQKEALMETDSSAPLPGRDGQASLWDREAGPPSPHT